MERTIYEVVKVVRPGAVSIAPAGRHGIDWTVDEGRARHVAAQFNDARNDTRGIRYTVERHAEDCPGRTFGHHPDGTEGPCHCGGGIIRP